MERRGRTPQVKNKMPAPVQITAEQLIREAQQHQEYEPKAPKQRIADAEELAEYRMRKRKEFEDQVHKQRMLMSNYLKYAQWEERQGEMRRARSIFERALDVDYTNINIWLKYVEMEMRHKNVNHARNIWDRAVVLLPRVDQLWYKFIYMEDILGNYAGARQIFERWMEWEPDEPAWNAYIKFEIRNHEYQLARKVYERFVLCHPRVKSWVRYAKFEESLGEIPKARSIYERAIEYLGELGNDEKLFIAFAEFEQRAQEVERARAIYKYALDNIPKAEAQKLYKLFIEFEKKFGDRENIEEVILSKKRFQYEDEIEENPHNYDVWFDYIRLEESTKNHNRIRDTYERAIANVPLVQEKRYWRRYIFLWINYAVFEELVAKDFERARDVYKACLKVLPHKVFSFSKIWILYAKFEIRQKKLEEARRVLGQGIGLCGKSKIFQYYIGTEVQLGNIDRCRTLYQKWLETHPSSCDAWVHFAEFEYADLGETERGRAIFELGVEQPELDLPEVLWKAYIDFTIEQEEYDNTRELYKRLLSRTKHVKVWISFAQFEHSIGNNEAARKIHQDAYESLKQAEMKEERVLLVQSWKQFEEAVGSEEGMANVKKLMPKKIKKKRAVKADDGSIAGWEEYYEYIFPDEETKVPGMKILEMAYKWKQKQAAQE